MNKTRKIFAKYILQNLGLINLFGKSFGRILYLILTAYLSFRLSVNDFAEFAIFWTSLRMFTFYGSNNLYIIYFNKVRTYLMDKQEWPRHVSSNIILNSSFFISIIAIVSILLFDDALYIVFLLGCLVCFLIIRYVAEFAKADNNLFLSIFIDDVLFYILFFVFCMISLSYQNNLYVLIISLFVASFLTAIIGIILFIRKFKIKIVSFFIKSSDFSMSEFKLGINYTFLRGNETLSNFAVRYLGQIYFGDIFVAYAHIMYQFYNIFSLLTMSVISGFQSKITVMDKSIFNSSFINQSYLKILKTTLPFIIVFIAVLAVFNNQILTWFFPKYVEYSHMLYKVGFAGIVFAIIQPLVFIMIYNNSFKNIVKLNYTQYLIMFLVFITPLVIANFNDEYWLLLAMTILVIVQGAFAFANYKNLT